MHSQATEGATTLVWIDSEEAIIVRWADRAAVEATTLRATSAYGAEERQRLVNRMRRVAEADGALTAAAYAAEVARAKTILWNGPMGIFEDKRFATGTNAVARAVAEATQKNGAKSIIGGGDSVKALNMAGLGDKVTFMSTGGGASLEFLEGAVLPGVAALSDK